MNALNGGMSPMNAPMNAPMNGMAGGPMSYFPNYGGYGGNPNTNMGGRSSHGGGNNTMYMNSGRGGRGEVGEGGGSAGEGCVCPVYSMVRMTGRPSSGGGGAGQGRPRPLPRRNRSVLQRYYGLRRRRRRPKIDSLLLKYRCWCL